LPGNRLVALPTLAVFEAANHLARLSLAWQLINKKSRTPSADVNQTSRRESETNTSKKMWLLPLSCVLFDFSHFIFHFTLFARLP
jgi:hypothetical protein